MSKFMPFSCRLIQTLLLLPCLYSHVWASNVAEVSQLQVIGDSEPLPELSLPRPVDTTPLTSVDTPIEDEDEQPVSANINAAFTFMMMGSPDGLSLNGHQPQSGIKFTLPEDQVIQRATLQLKLRVSGELTDGQHYLNLMLNGQDLARLPLSQANDDVSDFDVDIPAPMLVATNNLSVTLDDGKTLMCEAGSDTHYRLVIEPDSRFEYQAVHLNTAPDLSRFPWPFIDTQDMTRAQVAIGFSAKPTPEALGAAAIVSAYLGYHVDYKGINLPVSLGVLPAQSAIIFARPGEQIGEMTIPQRPGAALWITTNPLNPMSKLLVVSGHNRDEFTQAAWALTHSVLPAGNSLNNIVPQKLPVSKPYDAPRWIDTRSPVTLAALTEGHEKLSAYGLHHDAIRVGFRTAPDLFMWDGTSIPFHLGYHFPSNDWIDDVHSGLNVSLNGRFLTNLPVNKAGGIEFLWRKLGGDMRQEHKKLAIQPWQIYGDNQFSFWFDVKPRPDAPCAALNDNGIKSSLDEFSTIDLSHSYHFSELPNLAYFVGASFPFSRLADFSQTLILLADNPSEQEIGVMLAMMARTGNATGMTPHGVRIAFISDAFRQGKPRFHAKDILAIAALPQQAFWSPLLAKSPFDYQQQTLMVRKPTLLQQVKSLLMGDWSQEGQKAARYLSSAAQWRGFISFQSPWDGARSVVVVTATQDAELAQLPQDLRIPSINAGVRGDITLISNSDGVHSWRTGEHYISGEMPWYLRIIWFASQHLILLGIACVMLAAVTGRYLYCYLKKQAEKRLMHMTEYR